MTSRAIARIALLASLASGCVLDGAAVDDGEAAEAVLGSANRSFQNGVYPSASYAGTRDTELSQNAPASNFGGAATIRVDGDDPGGSGRDVSTLVRWDVSSVPRGSTIRAATITFYVSNASPGSYQIYECRRNWVESQATWNGFASGQAWEIAGARGAADRGTTSLGTVRANATGSYTVTLNAAGLALVQRWVNDPSTNRGLIVANASTTDGADFDSSESATPSRRPRLTLGWDPPDPPDACGGAEAGVDASGGTGAEAGVDASADAGAAPDGGAGDGGPASLTPCWPFDRPAISALRASRRKVFAHYFSPYPISIDNQPPETDYYARHYLNPAGESSRWAFCGGLLRERPWGQSPRASGVDWQLLNMEIEVRRAIAAGLDGFTYDVLNPNPTSAHRVRLDKILEAARRVDPGFEIQLVLDMTANAFGGNGGTDATAMEGIVTLFRGVGTHPSLQRLPDGRVVVSAFAAERRNATFWRNALSQLATMGHRVAFIPMPVGSWPSNAARFEGVPLYGASSWGVRTVSGAAGLRTATDQAHAAGLIWMAPVAPQDSRPKELTFVESHNSRAFRALWDVAISGGADWVQLITWNDYSEDSEVAPSSRTRTAFYDLTAYYTTWFKTGAQPAIVRDALYYFHRTHDMNVAPDLTRQRSAFRAVNGPSTSSNEIELVGLLTAPGTLEISVGGTVRRLDVGAGIQSLRVPLVEGTPTFRLLRGGATVVSVTSGSPISNRIVYQDPLYHAGASDSCAR